MPLTSLTLKFFQKHKHQQIQFGPGVNALVGKTGAGKSALLRAIRWICLNDPAGDEFVHWESDGCCGILEVDGRKIVRRRGKGVNSYKLDKKEFKAFASTVPPEIFNFLKIGEYQFQGQLDPPLWFMLTPGQVSKELNQIINLGQIDDAMSLIASKVRKAGSDVDLTEERIKKANDRVEELSWVTEFTADVDQLAILDAKRQEQARSCVRLRSLVLDAQRDALVKRSVEKLSIDAGALDAIRQAADAHEESRRNLELLAQDADQQRKELCHLQQNLERLQKQLQKLEKERCPTCGQKLSQSSPPTGISGTKPRWQDRSKKTGTR